MQRAFLLPSPASAVLLSAAIFGLAHLTSPYHHYELGYSTQSYFLLATNLILIATVPICHRFQKGPTRSSLVDTRQFIRVLNSPATRFAFRICVLLSLVGGILKCYDLFVARSEVFLSDLDVNEKYSANAETATSISGVLGSLLYPISLPCILLVAARKRIGLPVQRYRLTMAILIAMASIPIINSLLIGKRGAIVAVAAFGMFFAQYLLGRRFNLREIVIAGIGGTLIFIVLAKVLAHRLEEKGASMLDVALTARFTHLMSPTSAMHSIPRVLPDSLDDIFSDYTVFSGYITHSFPEYLYLVDQHDLRHCSNGATTFGIFFKFLSYIGIGHYDAGELERLFPREYVYTTLFGALFLDFGYASVLVSLLIGFLFVLCYERARSDIFFVPLYCYLYLVVLWSPMICFLYMFYGMYYMWATLFFAFGMNAWVYFSQPAVQRHSQVYSTRRASRRKLRAVQEAADQ